MSKAHRSDLSASITVFLIAVPLSLGLALATGAPLQSGLVATAVGGIVAGLLGGAPLQVSGAATSLVVVTAGLVERYGWRATCAITVLAGLAQLLLGTLRVARAALAVSPAIVHGMLAGIGTVIAVGQLHVVLGGSPQISAIANIGALPRRVDARPPHHPDHRRADRGSAARLAEAAGQGAGAARDPRAAGGGRTGHRGEHRPFHAAGATCPSGPSRCCRPRLPARCSGWPPRS